MTQNTQRLVLAGLRTKGYGNSVFDKLLEVAAQVTAPDAIWLHGLLAKQSMPWRDGFLCGYLHERIGTPGAVERLLRAPFEVESTDIQEPVVVRWATLLLWFCVAADRRVRDRATKGLIAITQGRPTVWVTLIREFAPVNDEYVVERCFCAAYGALLRSRDREAERDVAAAAYDAVFADPTVIQNALVRDHARCIVELAQLDGVLGPNIDIKRARPPYASDWPLMIPSKTDVERYKEARLEYPKLYLSCLDDDFYTYTLRRLDAYEHAMSRDEMGRWILNHIISDIGYGGKSLASYDGSMLYTYGGGRGRPGWAERIGKKYQWIALSRLAARLGDHVKPKANPWEPKIRGTPLIYADGRDIDPGLLARGGRAVQKGAVWWLPVEYDFAAVNAQSNTEWTRTSSDVPPSDRLLLPLARADGGEWQVLEAYPSWSARSRKADHDGFTPHRDVWTQIRGYFVKRRSASRVFSWMAQQHFMGRWMPEGIEFHEGFVGEYPWGTLFAQHPDPVPHYRGDRRAPARLVPVCNSISTTYEEDAYQGGAITVHVPARAFFEGTARLCWDGLGGYHDAEGRVRFLDPSASELGPSALLVDRAYLLDFLARHELAIVWSVLGEKIFIGGHADASPRLEFSRAHLLDQSGKLLTSDLRVVPGSPSPPSPGQPTTRQRTSQTES